MNVSSIKPLRSEEQTPKKPLYPPQTSSKRKIIEPSLEHGVRTSPSKIQKTESSPSVSSVNTSVLKTLEVVDQELKTLIKNGYFAKTHLISVTFIATKVTTKSLQRFFLLKNLFGATFQECKLKKVEFEAISQTLEHSNTIECLYIQKDDSINEKITSVFHSKAPWTCSEERKGYWFLSRNPQYKPQPKMELSPQKPSLDKKTLIPKKLIGGSTSKIPLTNVQRTLNTIRIPKSLFQEKPARPPVIRDPEDENLQLEHEVRDFIQQELKSQGIESDHEIAAKTETGFHIGDIDICTANEIIEVKEHKLWKHALGQILAYGSAPTHVPKQKMLALFSKTKESPDELRLAEITEICKPFGVQVQFVSWAK